MRDAVLRNMSFDLSDLLEAVGPTASLIFAAWIFLSFLQQRYSGAYQQYRAMLDEYRRHQRDKSTPRQESMYRQIFLYKKRCEQMKRATNIGVFAAILLMLTVISGAVNVILGDTAIVRWTGGLCAIVGLAFVISASVYVIRENASLQDALDLELHDIPELAEKLKNQKG